MKRMEFQRVLVIGLGLSRPCEFDCAGAGKAVREAAKCS